MTIATIANIGIMTNQNPIVAHIGGGNSANHLA